MTSQTLDNVDAIDYIMQGSLILIRDNDDDDDDGDVMAMQ